VGDVVVVVGDVVVVVGDVVVVVGDVEQTGTVTWLSSRVTAPFRARTRPLTVAPVSSVTDVRASTVPAKLVVVPRVAELPTCQNTLHAWAPFSKTTLAELAVVSVDAAWKMKTALASPPAFNVTVPVSAMLDVDR
ncbi:MAG TPA: hypothetical protein PLS29_02445, partial [Acidimicrobiales bacterium]|nr:hypothetical protein [Acidimicrobiales bacterium]